MSVDELVKKPQKKTYLVVWLRAADLFLCDGDVNHSLRGHRYTNCDDPEEDMSL